MGHAVWGAGRVQLWGANHDQCWIIKNVPSLILCGKNTSKTPPILTCIISSYGKEIIHHIRETLRSVVSRELSVMKAVFITWPQSPWWFDNNQQISSWMPGNPHSTCLIKPTPYTCSLRGILKLWPRTMSIGWAQVGVKFTCVWQRGVIRASVCSHVKDGTPRCQVGK